MPTILPRAEGQRPDGLPLLAPVDTIQIPTWRPALKVVAPSADATAILDPVDEQTVINEGGTLFGGSSYGYQGSGKALIVAGRYRHGTQNQNNSGVYVVPLNGLIARDEFTISFALNPGAADLQGASTWTMLLLNTGGSAQQFFVQVSGGVLVARMLKSEAGFTPPGVDNLINTAMTLAVGDIPAGVFTTISITFVRSTGVLNLYLDDYQTGVADTTSGSNVTVLTSGAGLAAERGWVVGQRIYGAGIPGGTSITDVSTPGQLTLSANATATATGVAITQGRSATNAGPIPATWIDKPWSCDPRVQGGGLVIGSGATVAPTAQGPAGEIVSDGQTYRYARTPGQKDRRPGPAVTLDATAGLGAWPDTLGGSTVQYTYWDRAESVEEASDPGGVSRAQQIGLVRSAGMKHVRVAEFNERSIPTIGGGVVQSVDASGLIAHLDRFLERGFTISMHVGYMPTAMGGGTGSAAYRKPNATTIGAANQAAANLQYARYVSMTFTAVQAHYDGLHGAGWFASKFKSLSFWNEPNGFWTDGVTVFCDLWEACARQWQTDHPDLVAIGGPDENYSPASAGGGTSSEAYQRGVIDRAAAQGLPYGSAHLHVYNYAIPFACEQYDGLKAYLVSKGFVNPPVYLTETGYLLDAQFWFSGDAYGHLLGYEDPIRTLGVWAGAHHISLLKELLDRGSRMSIFYRLAQAATALGFDQFQGLMSNQSPPRGWPILGMMELFWKLTGTRVSATTTFPHLHALASRESNGRITMLIVSYKGHRRNEAKSFQIAYTAGLPANFTWRQWRLDKREERDGRPSLLAEGDETNLPLAGDLTGEGVMCIQITPTGAAGAAPVTPAPVNTAAPVISGTAYTGQALSCTIGTWTNPLGVFPVYAFQWQRNGVDIGGATGSSYTLVSADEGKSIRCRVTATSDGGATTVNSNTYLACAVPTTFSQHALADNPVSGYRNNEPSGTTMTDILGVLNGTYVGATLNQTGLTTDGDKAATFAGGSSSRGQIADNAQNRFGTGDWAFECLIKTASVSCGIVDKHGGSNPAEFGAQINGSGKVFIQYNGGTLTHNDTAVNDNAVHHVVVGRRGTLVYVLVDGLPPSSNPTATIPANTLHDCTGGTLSIAMRGLLAASGLAGTVDEVYIYNHDVPNSRWLAHSNAR